MSLLYGIFSASSLICRATIEPSGEHLFCERGGSTPRDRTRSRGRIISVWLLALLVSVLPLAAQETAPQEPTAVGGQPLLRIEMDLDEAIATAHDQSPSALLARHTFLTGYWEYRAFRAEQLPSLRLSGGLGQYNRSLVMLQDAETGAYNYISNNALNNSLSLSLNQNITLTGGTLSVTSGLGRLDQFAPERHQVWNSSPVYVSLNQPISAYNSFRWEKKIEPRKYELAKREYIEAMESITVAVTAYFFDLLLAQRQLETARASRENTAQLHAIAQERFRLGSLSRDEVLQLELKLLNDDLSISDCAVTAQVAMMRLRNYLGYNETVELSLRVPETEGMLQLSYEDVLAKVFEHSSTLLGYEIQTLTAARAVAQAKAAAGPSANLQARFGLNQVGSDLPAAYRNPLDQEVVGLTLSLPILDWGLNRGRVKLAESQAEVVEAQIGQALASLRENVALKVMQFNRQGGQCEVSRKAEAVGQDRYAAARERFLAGATGVTELNTAQAEMESASIRYLQDLSAWWQYYYAIRQMTLYDYLNRTRIEASYTDMENLTR